MKDAIYIKVGTSYYKKIEHPLASGDVTSRIVIWNRGSIIEDHGKEFLVKKVPKYDSFCFVPDNINYQREVKRNLKEGKNGSYNTYEPVNWEPEEGDFNTILKFLKHIFGHQLEIGLDYLTIIWKIPTQVLPILCLVSEERSTGKTTFLKLLKLIFGHNMSINTNEDFRNQFNSGWASKIVIGAEEILLDKKEDAEKLKNLSTAPLIKSEAKGKDKIEQEFYGKFILCSNNESDFIKIDPQEIRFWVRKIPHVNNDNVNLIEDMKKEIPAFIDFLTKREIISPNRSRMWFTREQIWTDALSKVINAGKSKLEEEIRSLLIDQILTCNLDELDLTPKDIIELLRAENNVFARKADVIKIIRGKWGYEQSQPGYYKRWFFKFSDNEGNMVLTSSGRTGRYYTFPKTDFIR